MAYDVLRRRPRKPLHASNVRADRFIADERRATGGLMDHDVIKDVTVDFACDAEAEAEEEMPDTVRDTPVLQRISVTAIFPAPSPL